MRDCLLFFSISLTALIRLRTRLVYLYHRTNCLACKFLQWTLILNNSSIGFVFLHQNVLFNKLKKWASFLVRLTCVTFGQLLKLARCLTQTQHNSGHIIVVGLSEPVQHASKHLLLLNFSWLFLRFKKCLLLLDRLLCVKWRYHFSLLKRRNIFSLIHQIILNLVWNKVPVDWLFDMA